MFLDLMMDVFVIHFHVFLIECLLLFDDDDDAVDDIKTNSVYLDIVTSCWLIIDLYTIFNRFFGIVNKYSFLV